VKATLRMLWRRMAPAFWRLAGFASLSVIALFGAFAIVAGIIGAMVAGGLGGSAELIGVVVIVVLLMFAVAVPLTVWLSTKLLLVPSVLVLERARFRDAFVRSWRLTRGRFWVAFGVMALIGLIMGLAMQVVNIPAALLGSILPAVIAPTGSAEPSAVVGFVFAIIAPQVLLLVLQAITLVVQSTGGALIYLDCRMRYEGLDQTLLSYVERRDLGWTEEQQGDPYVVDPAKAVSSAPPPRQVPDHVRMTQGYGYPPYGAPQPYPPQPYGAAQPNGAPPAYGAPQPYATQQPYPPQQPYAPQQQPAPEQQPAPPQQPAAAFPPPPPPAPATPPASPSPRGDADWTAPGGGDASA
jgi:hypothetical protein